MAFYKSVKIKTILIDCIAKRLKSLEILSVPSSNDLKTIARVSLIA